MATSAAATGLAFVNGVALSGKDLRYLVTGYLANGSTGINVRSGVRPGVGAAAVTVPVSGMQVQVAPGVVFIQSSSGGAYMLYWDSAKTLDVPAAESQSRKDIVVARVVDNGDATTTFTVEVVKGTAGSGVAPAVPTNSLYLKDVAVAASVTAISNGNLTGSPVWTGPVGVLSCKDSTEYPQHATQGGAQVWDRTLEAGLLSVNGVWQEVSRASIPSNPVNGRIRSDRNDGTITVNTLATDPATTWLDKSGAPSTAIRVGSSGIVKVIISVEAKNDTSLGNSARMSYKATGANTIVSTFSRSASNLNTKGVTASRAYLHEGLNPGTTTFTCQFYAAAGTAQFDDMSILVEAY